MEPQTVKQFVGPSKEDVAAFIEQPVQIWQQVKTFLPPTASIKTTTEELEIEIDVEFYTVLYTKHLHQRSKVWEDGFMEYHYKNHKCVLFASSSRCQQMEQKFYKTAPDLAPGEVLRFNKFLVEIVTKRAEGKSSVKRDARSSSKNSIGSSTPTSTFKAGLTTGINCIHNKPLSALPKLKNTGFPKLGRKPFQVPSKAPLPDRPDSEDDTPAVVHNNKPTLQQLISMGPQQVPSRSEQLQNMLLKVTKDNVLSDGERDIFELLKGRMPVPPTPPKPPKPVKVEKPPSEVKEPKSSKGSRQSSKKRNKSKSSKKHKKHKKDKKDKKDKKHKRSKSGKDSAISADAIIVTNPLESLEHQPQPIFSKMTCSKKFDFIPDMLEGQLPDCSSSDSDSEQSTKEIEGAGVTPVQFTFEPPAESVPDMTDLIRKLGGKTEQKFTLPITEAPFVKQAIQPIPELQLFDADIELAESPQSSQETLKRALPAKTADYHAPQKLNAVQNQIHKINALDRLKQEQEARLNKHNRQAKSFDDLLIDFLVSHDIHLQKSSRVLRNREEYAGFYILAVIEMLKYAVKEDYENSRSEINLISIEFEYIKPDRVNNKANQNKLKAKKKKQQNQKYEDSSDEQAKSEQGEDSETEEIGAFYIKFKEGIPPLVRKDLMIEDLWLLMKRPLVTNQQLSDVSDMILVKNCWHSNNKQQKLKVLVMGEADQVKFRADQYKFAYKSVNLQSYRSLITNLASFRSQTNPYVDSMLGIANTKSKFKIIKPCDKELVEAIRQATCCGFKLNSDQEFVLNEVTKWFLNKPEELSQKKSQEDFDILGIEDALNDSPSTEKHVDSNVILVHGAFGCGKSYLLVAIIRFICTLLDQVHETETKILVCALTNVAVDRILLMLKESGYNDFARVGSLKKIHKSLLPYSHHSANQKKKSDTEALKDLQAMAEELTSKAGNKMTKEQYDELQAVQTSIQQIRDQSLAARIEALATKRVVGATCAATEFEIMQGLQFKIVILDECSQMLEPQSLLPISKFNCRKLIAVGDPLQLPPIISFSFKEKRLQQQKILEASNQKDDKISPHLPLFVRLQKAGQPSILLRTQYRCHPNIAQVANYLFYENYLLNGVKAEARKRLISKFCPITFISAEKGVESKSEFSFRNYYEANFIVALLNYLMNLVMRLKQGIPISDSEGHSSDEPVVEENPPDYSIGVILTYRSQANLIQQLIDESNNDFLRNVQVSTVDAFQGAERDIIVVGCVRTRNLGFIEDCRRLNVAITRARRHLIVVGKESLLKRSTHWKYIIDKSQDKTAKLVGYKKVEDFVKMGGLFKQMMKEFQ